MAVENSNASALADSQLQRWRLDTLSACSLAIGAYPRFSYNASGGGATSQPAAELLFPVESVQILPLNWRTTRFLGLPLPPGLEIRIAPERLAGRLDAGTGTVQLDFRARFHFRIAIAGWPLLEAPPLLVATSLSTAAAAGERHRAQGQPLDARGRARLVGVATITPTGTAWLDRFLGLPDEALAELDCRFTALP